MADTAIAITAGTGTNVDTRTESTNGNHRQVMVIGDPSTNAGVAPVDATKGLAVDLSNTGANTNKLLVTPDLPSGAATAAKQPALGTAGTASADVITVQGITSMTPLKTDGSGVTQPVSGTVSITANSAVNVAQINGVTPLMGAGNTGTGSPRVTIASDQAAIPASQSGTWTVQPGNTANTTAWKVDASSVAVPVTDNAGSLTVDGTITASNTAGDVAHDGADSGNPVKIGGKAVSSEPTAVANADRANLITDLVGKLITLPYANPENFVSGAITSAMTGTTSTSLIAAPAAGLRNYITQITVSNAHATVGTDVIIQDGSGGTTLYTIPAAAVYGGAAITFPVALRQPTTATAIYCANVTTGASTKVSASGYKGV